jgi:hypothetical protein
MKEQDAMSRRRIAGTDTVILTAVVTTSLAFQNDTLPPAFVVAPSSRVQVFGDSLTLCGEVTAYGQQKSPGVFVIFGNLSAGAMRALPVWNSSRPPYQGPLEKCDASKRTPSDFVAFLAGGLGGEATAPFNLKFASQSKPFIIDPAKHTLAAQPHLKFRIADLRAGTRVGGSLQLRVRALGAIDPNVRMLVVVADGAPGVETMAFPQSATGPGVWDFNAPFSFSNGFGKDAYVLVYLFQP